MRASFRAISLILALISVSAFAGSRVGNRFVADEKMGYAMKIPAALCDNKGCPSRSSEDGSSIQLFDNSSNTAFVQGIVAQRLKLFITNPDLPSFKTASRENIRYQLRSLSGQSLNSLNPCVDEWKVETDGVFHLMAFWGTGKMKSQE